jgi:hypothetical protein
MKQPAAEKGHLPWDQQEDKDEDETYRDDDAFLNAVLFLRTAGWISGKSSWRPEAAHLLKMTLSSFPSGQIRTERIHQLIQTKPEETRSRRGAMSVNKGSPPLPR